MSLIILKTSRDKLQMIQANTVSVSLSLSICFYIPPIQSATIIFNCYSCYFQWIWVAQALFQIGISVLFTDVGCKTVLFYLLLLFRLIILVVNLLRLIIISVRFNDLGCITIVINCYFFFYTLDCYLQRSRL